LQAFGLLNPLPPDLELVKPRQLPKRIVPSFVGEQGQVLNLLMREGSGNIVRDYSGFNNHGQLFGGVKWTDEGIATWALEFNGIDGRVIVPHKDVLNIAPGNKITIEIWAYLTGWQSRSVCRRFN